LFLGILSNYDRDILLRESAIGAHDSGVKDKRMRLGDMKVNTLQSHLRRYSDDRHILSAPRFCSPRVDTTVRGLTQPKEIVNGPQAKRIEIPPRGRGGIVLGLTRHEV
jgi:hypothetical protein